jgi:hypothetical protein
MQGLKNEYRQLIQAEKDSHREREYLQDKEN